MRYTAPLLMLLMSACTFAHEYTNQHIYIDHPWARPTFALAKTAAVYLELHNQGEVDDQLLSVKVSSDVASAVELHDMIMRDDMMSMQAIGLPLEIKPQDKKVFQPGGKHMMLVGLKEPLAIGEKFAMTLNFANAGEVEVIVNVEDKPKAKKQAQHHHH